MFYLSDLYVFQPTVTMDDHEKESEIFSLGNDDEPEEDPEVEFEIPSTMLTSGIYLCLMLYD